MRILVTGACGFIGRHVWRLLEAKGHELVGIDALVEQVHGPTPDIRRIGKEQGALGRIYHAPVSVCAEAAAFWGRCVGEVDAVIHLAAEVGVAQSEYEPARYVQANVLETAQLWERIIEHRSRIRKVVVASSMSIYGEGEYWVRGTRQSDRVAGSIRRACARGWDAFDAVDAEGRLTPMDGQLSPMPTRESKPAEPASVYALSKYDTERYSLMLGDAYDVPTVALRFFNTYGEGQALANAYTGALAIFACRVLNGRAPLVYEDGQQMRDFIHVSDVARAVVTAVESPDLAGAYNVATGTGTSVGQLAEAWCRIAADRGLPVVEPQIVGKYRVGDTRHCIGSPDKFTKATGWKAERTIADGLPAVAEWILANHFDHDVPVDHTEQAVGEMRAHGLER